MADCKIRKTENRAVAGHSNKLSLSAFDVCVLSFFSLFVLIVFTDYKNITAVKYNTFLVLSSVMTVFYIVGSVRKIFRSGFALTENSTVRYVYIFLMAFLIVNYISAFFSPYLGEVNSRGQSVLFFGDRRYDGLLVLTLYAVVFIIVSLKVPYRRLFGTAVTITLAAVSLIGILQLLKINVLGFYPAGNFYDYKIFISTVGNIDVFSTLYCILLPLLAFDTVANRKKRLYDILQMIVYTLSVFLLFEVRVDSGRVAFSLMLFVALNILFFKPVWYTRFLKIFMLSFFGMLLSSVLLFEYNQGGGVLKIRIHIGQNAILLSAGIVLTLVFSCVYRYYRERGEIKKFYIFFAAVQAAALVFLLCWILFLSEPTNGVFYEFSEILKGRGKDSYGNNRYGLWRYTLQLSNRRFLIGYGSGTFRLAFAEYTQGISQGYSSGIFDMAHNEFLQIYYNSGILGILFYGAFTGSLMFLGIKNSLRSPGVMILTFSGLCYLLQSFFTFSIVIVSPLFWIILGMLCCEIKKLTEKTDERSA